jgi:hypothetical protein
MSGDKQHSGSITLDFKTEKDFKVFGYQYAKCNANLQVKGEISKPRETGSKWQYEVPYKFGCGCETVLGNFNTAYEDAFHKKGQASSARFSDYSYDELPLHSLQTNDYTAKLDTCGIPRRQTEGREIADIDDAYWNIGFTNMIRTTNGAAWGNWTLNPGIVPGAVGILDPKTGSFTPVGTLPGAKVTLLKSPEDWVIESSSVHRTSSEVDFKGGYHDPSTNTDVKVGLDVAWSFATEGSIVSSATIQGVAQVDDFGSAMAQNFDWLKAQAKDVGFATADGIIQGFGVVTSVKRCLGGINIGSLTSDSSFSLTGSVEGVNAITGGGDVSVGVHGSYKDTNQTKSFESHIWPAEADKAAAGEVGISYQFASYDGTTIMPTWIKELSGFAVVFANNHGGTYIGNCKVSYERIIDGKTNPYSKSTSVGGGETSTIDGIPLDATNMQIHVQFDAGDEFNFSFRRPVTTLLAGSCTVDMSGVWPWGSHATLRVDG